MSTDDLTPEGARAALAEADRMTRAGFKRGFWPRWALAVEAAWVGLMITCLGLWATHMDLVQRIEGAERLIDVRWGETAGPYLAALVGVMISGLVFRYYCVFRFKVVPKMGWLDAVTLTLVLLGGVAAVELPWLFEYRWAPWPLGVAAALVYFGRYELGRRLPPAVTETEPQA